jgi:hypothetical protein
MLATAAIAAVPATITTPAAADCSTSTCDERVARKSCDQSHVRACIRRAALTHRVSFSVLYRKARCESGLNPYAYFGHPRNRVPNPIVFQFDISAGVAQFKPSTWNTTPYRRHSIWSAKFNSLAAAWMHRPDVGRGGEWVCR